LTSRSTFAASITSGRNDSIRYHYAANPFRIPAEGQVFFGPESLRARCAATTIITMPTAMTR
jgi:hypothetical protein